MNELQILARSSIFRDLEPGLIPALFERGRRKTLSPGTSLFNVGDHYQQEIYIVLSGSVLIRRPDGETYDVAAGDFIGLSSFLDHAPYSSTALSRDTADFLVLSEASFAVLKTDFPGLSTAVNRSIADRIRRWNPGRRGTSGVLVQKVRSVMSTPLAACGAETTLLQALQLMRSRKISALGVIDDQGVLLGLTSPGLIADAVLLRQVDVGTALSESGVERAYTVPPDAPLWQAEQLLQDHEVKELVVQEEGVPIGMISQTDIVRLLCVRAQRNLLIGRASQAMSCDELRDLSGYLDQCALGALEHNRRAMTALHILSETHLAMMRRCVELTLQELLTAGQGAAPAPYALLIMGSGGRREMMLAPDQDNGLILADEVDADPAMAAWFESFTRRLNDNFAWIGYPLCPGEIMARNPQFCKTLAQWKRQVSHLAAAPTEKAARWSNVVLDFDTLYGDEHLTMALREHVHAEFSGGTRLLSMMVDDDAEGRPPIGFFNRLVTSEQKESKGRIDVKRNGLRIIADAARIYALSRGVKVSNTQDRISALVRLGAIDADLADGAISAYDELASLVLDHQLAQRRQGDSPDKFIDPAELTPYQRETLRDSMLAVKRFQEKLQGDFARISF